LTPFSAQVAAAASTLAVEIKGKITRIKDNRILAVVSSNNRSNSAQSPPSQTVMWKT
jgi:hypothetical protein